jgi:hypothetical protein
LIFTICCSCSQPVNIVKYRFNPGIIKKIIASQWWTKEIDELKADEKEFASFLKPLG